MLNIAPVKLGRGKVVHAMWTGNDAHRGYIVGGCVGNDVTPLADAETAITCRRCQNALPSWINVGPVVEASPLDACEHGTAPQNFCQGCYDTKSAYAAQVDKVRAIRARVAEVAHAEAIEMDERRTIARAYLSTPAGVVLTDAEIDEACAASEQATEDLIKGQRRTTEVVVSRAAIRAELLKMQTQDLRVMAKNALITGYSRTPRAELVDLLIDERMINQKISAAEAGAASRARRGQQTAPKVEIHTAGELHTPPCTPRVTFAYNLSDLLDDPARKPDAELVKLDGTDARMQDFVFATEGAQDLYWDMVRDVTRQLARGKSVVVMVLCRGGKHRSVAFGENLAEYFEVKATHHHRHLPIVEYADGKGR